MSRGIQPPHSRKAPCPCGSGKRYKHCHGARPDPAAGPKRLWLGWIAGIGVAAVLGVILVGPRGNSPRSPTGFPLFGGGAGGFGPTSYAAIDGVEMPGLSQAQRAQVMQRANTERCNCGCGMTLAQCINVDTACPFRGQHLQRVGQLVAQAARGS